MPRAVNVTILQFLLAVSAQFMHCVYANVESITKFSFGSCDNNGLIVYNYYRFDIVEFEKLIFSRLANIVQRWCDQIQVCKQIKFTKFLSSITCLCVWELFFTITLLLFLSICSFITISKWSIKYSVEKKNAKLNVCLMCYSIYWIFCLAFV